MNQAKRSNLWKHAFSQAVLLQEANQYYQSDMEDYLHLGDLRNAMFMQDRKANRYEEMVRWMKILEDNQ
jgi:hypothetical protein